MDSYSKFPDTLSSPQNSAFMVSSTEDPSNPLASGPKNNISRRGILSSSGNSARSSRLRVVGRLISSVRFIDENMPASPVASEHHYEVDDNQERSRDNRSSSPESDGEIKMISEGIEKMGDDDTGTRISHKDSLDLICKRGISIKPNSSIKYRDKHDTFPKHKSDKWDLNVKPTDSFPLLVDGRRQASSPDVEEGEYSRKTRHQIGKTIQDNNWNTSGILKRRSDANRNSRRGGNVTVKISQPDDPRNMHNEDTSMCEHH